MLMEDEKLLLEMPENKDQEVINTGELITDYSFNAKIRQLNLILDPDKENGGFCWEG